MLVGKSVMTEDTHEQGVVGWRLGGGSQGRETTRKCSENIDPCRAVRACLPVRGRPHAYLFGLLHSCGQSSFEDRAPNSSLFSHVTYLSLITKTFLPLELMISATFPPIPKIRIRYSGLLNVIVPVYPFCSMS